jgi:hypothetical protein
MTLGLNYIADSEYDYEADDRRFQSDVDILCSKVLLWSVVGITGSVCKPGRTEGKAGQYCRNYVLVETSKGPVHLMCMISHDLWDTL